MLSSFLQSKEWEEFQKSIDRKTWRVGSALLLKHDLPFGLNYLYCPRLGFGDMRHATSSEFFNEVRKIVDAGKPIFLKIDPAAKLQIANCRLQISESIQPRKTTIINLRKSEDELLRSMHEKTRYNIRLAERRGVQIANCKLQSANYFDKFWRLLQGTAKRDGFHTHERRHYEKLLDIRTEYFSNELFCAEYRGEILAAAVANFYGDTVTYLHGASSRESKEVMTAHLLHWRIIQEAKQRGFGKYDLGGVDEEKWPGVTRFKLGFGGEFFEYPPSIDIIYRPILYTIYRLTRNLRKYLGFYKLDAVSFK